MYIHFVNNDNSDNSDKNDIYIFSTGWTWGLKFVKVVTYIYMYTVCVYCVCVCNHSLNSSYIHYDMLIEGLRKDDKERRRERGP